MKLRSLAAVLLIAAISLVSCSKKKEDVIVPVSPLQGLWEGKWGSWSNTPDNYFAFDIKSDGTMTVTQGNGTPKTGSGTWAVVETTFKATYQYVNNPVKYSVTAKLDDKLKALNGDWFTGDVNPDGTFYLNKK